MQAAERHGTPAAFPVAIGGAGRENCLRRCRLVAVHEENAHA